MTFTFSPSLPTCEFVRRGTCSHLVDPGRYVITAQSGSSTGCSEVRGWVEGCDQVSDNRCTVTISDSSRTVQFNGGVCD